MPDLIPTMPPPTAEPVNPFGLLSPVVQEMVSTVSVLQRAIVEERQQHAMALAQKDAEHAAEVRGLTARLEAVEAEIEVCRRNLDRGWTGPMTGPCGGVTVTNGGVTVTGARA